MGREIRRVPVGWEHPKDEQGAFVSLYDKPYEDALNEWLEEHRQWEEGTHEHQDAAYKHYAQYWGDPPSINSYRKEKWTMEEATGWVMYENVSEGTPLTPVFATREELADFLCTQKDFWGYGPISREAAERFTASGWAPSLIAGPNIGLQQGYTFVPEPHDNF